MDPALINDNVQRNTVFEDLTEELIGQILSLLTIKQAVRTSLVSKHLEHTWKGMPNIKLIENQYDSREEFLEVGNILLTSCFSSFKKFTLMCSVGENSSTVKEWLNGFVKSTTEELNIHIFEPSEQLLFPEHLFNSKSLKHLEWEMKHPIILPPVLKLRDVIFTGTNQTQNFFSGCPSSLEELRLLSCVWDDVESIRIDSSSLHSLYIEDWQHFEDHPPSCCKIVISENNKLKTFSYDGRAVNLFELSFAPSVTSATLELELYPQQLINDLDPGQLVCNFLGALSNVKTLTINACAIETLCHSSHLARMTFMFCKLEKLEVMFDMELRPINLANNAMQIILRRAPFLKSLKFVEGVVLSEDIDQVPECFETHIKSIAIEKFGRTGEEKAAVKLLLKWAKVVSEFKLSVEVPAADLQELKDEIAKYPKSETCNLRFRV